MLSKHTVLRTTYCNLILDSRIAPLPYYALFLLTRTNQSFTLPDNISCINNHRFDCSCLTIPKNLECLPKTFSSSISTRLAIGWQQLLRYQLLYYLMSTPAYLTHPESLEPGMKDRRVDPGEWEVGQLSSLSIPSAPYHRVINPAGTISTLLKNASSFRYCQGKICPRPSYRTDWPEQNRPGQLFHTPSNGQQTQKSRARTKAGFWLDNRCSRLAKPPLGSSGCELTSRTTPTTSLGFDDQAVELEDSVRNPEEEYLIEDGRSKKYAPDRTMVLGRSESVHCPFSFRRLLH